MSDQHILSPINPKYDNWLSSDLRRFTKIVLKFEIALLFWTIHINLMKISHHILGLIGDQICWSDKKQPVIVDLKPPKICTTFKQQATSVFTILNCRSGRTSCMWKFSVVATRLEQRLGCAYFFFLFYHFTEWESFNIVFKPDHHFARLEFSQNFCKGCTENLVKGQLISKCLFGVIVPTKKATKLL